MKHTYISAAVMAMLGTGVFLGTGFYQPQPVSVPTEAVPESIEETIEETAAPLSAPPEEIETAEPFNPSPTELNLIHIFPEGADPSDMTKSYAGEAFRILMTQDETWMSGIYDYSDYAPLNLAARLGRSRDQVLGRYNPKDSTHDPDDPNTWTVNSFKEIRMQVTDGDGRPISVYSNVIDIMSMANVYTWYQDVQDYDLFLNYAKELWQASHSYSVSMSDVYYCSGCMDEEAEKREREQLEAAARAEEQGYITEEGMGVEKEPDQADYQEPETTASPVILTSRTKKAAEKASGAEEDNTLPAAGESSSAVITVGQSRQNMAEEASGTTDSENAVSETENSETGNSEAGNSETENSETENSETENSSSEDSGTIEADETAAADIDSESEASSEPESGHLDNEISDNELSAEQDTEASQKQDAGFSQNPEIATESDASAKTENHKTDCPGHIDLIIQMKICGLDEAKGLYYLDQIGNAESGRSDNGWPGWTDETKDYVTQLSSQDWFKNYGLSVSVISMLNPLTSSEIESYLERLPKALSPERRRLIEFALSSVGKVPYYWGGKASHPDFEGNQFGSLVSPDTKGRVLKGLDCSGWISWVYWTATGKRLPYESTSGLAVCGTRIGREQLQPGDIIVRTGADAHVIMFLGWAENGKILCIHESSAGVNNVTVAVRDANWPYYRKLLD